MASEDGSVVMTWERKYNSNGGYQTRIVAYNVSGNTVTQAATTTIDSASGGAYTRGELSDDGQFLMVDRLLYRFTGTSFTLIPVAGANIDWRGGNDGNDNIAVWNTALNGFVQVDKHNGDGFLVKRDVNGIWTRIKKFDLPGGSNHNAIHLDVSDLGTKVAVVTRHSDNGSQRMGVYSISNEVFTLNVSMDIGSSNPDSRSASSSHVAFSSGVGNFIFLAGFNAQEIRQYDARNLGVAALPIVSRIPTPLASRYNGVYTRMTRSGSDHLFLTYWNAEDPQPMEIISFQEP